MNNDTNEFDEELSKMEQTELKQLKHQDSEILMETTQGLQFVMSNAMTSSHKQVRYGLLKK